MLYVCYGVFIERPWVEYYPADSVYIQEHSSLDIPEDWTTYLNPVQKVALVVVLIPVMVFLSLFYYAGLLLVFLWRKGIIQFLLVLYIIYKLVMYGEKPEKKRNPEKEALYARIAQDKAEAARWKAKVKNIKVKPRKVIQGELREWLDAHPIEAK